MFARTVLIFGLLGLAGVCSPAEASVRCEDAFAETRLSKLEVINQILAPVSHTLKASSPESIRSQIYFLRERLHVMRLDPYQLQNESYRAWFIETLVDLRIERKASPLHAFEYATGRKDQKLLRSTMMA